MPLYTIQTNSHNNPDIKLIELQGIIEAGNPNDSQNTELGVLQLPDKDDPILQIGKQILKGKVVKLKRPLALLDTSCYMESDGSPNYAGTITQIIDEKIVFLTRPLISMDKT